MKRRNTTKTRPRDRGTGSFKERTRVLRDGTERRFFEGYVYAADGKQCYGSGTTQQEAEAKAMLNKYRHEQRLPAVLALTAILNNYPRTVGAPDRPDQAVTGDFVQPVVTMADYVRKFIKGRTLKRKSRVKYEGFLKNIEDTEFFTEYAASWPSLGAMPMTMIAKEHIDSFVDVFQDRWSERSAYNLQCFIKTVLTHAWDNHKKTGMTENPTTDLKVRHKRRRRRVPLSWELMQFLIQECQHPCLRAFLILACYGLRVGEIVALTEDDIDDNGRVTVRYTQAYVDNKERRPGALGKITLTVVGLDSPKTENAIRTIPIDPEAWPMLEESLAGSVPTEVHTYDRGWQVKRFLVPNARGRQWKADGVRRLLKKFLAELNIEALPHDWRASVITNLLDDADDELRGIGKISRFVGHSTIATTVDLYYHTTQKSFDDVGGAISKKLRNAVVTSLVGTPQLRILRGGRAS